MTTVGFAKDVEAPHLSQPRVSILTSATPINEPDTRWYGGYAFAPEGCAQGGIQDSCDDNDTMTGYSPPTTGWNPEVPTIPVVKPFIVYASHQVNTYSVADGRDVAAMMAKVDRKLNVLVPHYMEQQLWTDSEGLGNPALASANTTVISTGVSVTAVEALAELEDAIAACKSGGNMMIHVRPSMLIYLLNSQVIRRVGNVYLSALDTIVVPGRGYPGTGPSSQAVGTTEWMYASPQVQYRLGAVEYVPGAVNDNSSDAVKVEILKQAVDRKTNDITLFAERYVSATFDPTCCVLAIEVTRGLPNPSGVVGWFA